MNLPQVYMCSPSWTLLPPPSPFHPSAPAPSIQYHASNLDWQLVSYMIFYMFQCHSPKSSHPLPLSQSPIIQSEVSQKEKHQYSIHLVFWSLSFSKKFLVQQLIYTHRKIIKAPLLHQSLGPRIFLSFFLSLSPSLWLSLSLSYHQLRTTRFQSIKWPQHKLGLIKKIYTRKLTSDLETHTDWKWGDIRRYFTCKWKSKEAGKAIFISDKIDFKLKNVKRDKERHYTMTKGSIHEEDITIVNIYAPNTGTLQYIRQVLISIKGEISSNTTIVGSFNTQIAPMDGSPMEEN